MSDICYKVTTSSLRATDLDKKFDSLEAAEAYAMRKLVLNDVKSNIFRCEGNSQELICTVKGV